MALNITPDMQRAIAMADNIGVKFSTSHVEGVKWMWSAAEQYVEQYTGDFEYMLKLKDALKRFKKLGFANQVSGALNCMMVEIKRERRIIAEREREAANAQLAQEVIDFGEIDSESDYKGGIMRDADDYKVVEKASPKQVAPPKGYYTVAFDDGTHSTIRVTRVGDNARFAYLRGPNNEHDYQPFMILWNGKLRRVEGYKGGSRAETAVNVLLGASDHTAYGKAYAMMSNNCYRCGRPLTDPESIAASLGPVCRGAF